MCSTTGGEAIPLPLPRPPELNNLGRRSAHPGPDVSCLVPRLLGTRLKGLRVTTVLCSQPTPFPKETVIVSWLNETKKWARVRGYLTGSHSKEGFSQPWGSDSQYVVTYAQPWLSDRDFPQRFEQLQYWKDPWEMGSWLVKLKTSPEGCAMPTRC